MVIGIDEVGRGAWAGPLVVGAVALDRIIDGVRDSKKLTRSSREKLDVIIREHATFVGLGWVEPAEIDQMGLTKAMTLACHRALEQSPKDIEIIIDGHTNYLSSRPNVSTIINGDDIIPEISAASIVAKVARDRYMAQQGEKFPGYGFHTHVGYGTKAHIQAILEDGATPLHRLSFKPLNLYI